MTCETLELLKQLLDAQQLRVGDPEFAELAAKAIKAQTELRAAIEETGA
jgi:hypothetical protein